MEQMIISRASQTLRRRHVNPFILHKRRWQGNTKLDDKMTTNPNTTCKVILHAANKNYSLNPSGKKQTHAPTHYRHNALNGSNNVQAIQEFVSTYSRPGIYSSLFKVS